MRSVNPAALRPVETSKRLRIGPRISAPEPRAQSTEIEAEWAEHLGAGELARLRGTMLRLRGITDPYRPTHD